MGAKRRPRTSTSTPHATIPVYSLRANVPRSLQLAYADGLRCLVWDADDSRLVPASNLNGCLERFLRFHDAEEEPDGVLAFAREYGALGLPEMLAEVGREDLVNHFGPSLRYEPLLFWSRVARYFRAYLTAVHRIQRGELSALDPDLCFFMPPALEEALKAEERHLEATELTSSVRASCAAASLASWLNHLGSVNLAPIPRFRAGPIVLPFPNLLLDGLLTMLTMQTLAVSALDSGIQLCSICEKPYWILPGDPKRRRPWQGGRRSFCSDDCRLEAKRRDQRDRWLRDHPNPRRITKYRRSN